MPTISGGSIDQSGGLCSDVRHWCVHNSVNSVETTSSNASLHAFGAIGAAIKKLSGS